jgi:hypothetical protein
MKGFLAKLLAGQKVEWKKLGEGILFFQIPKLILIFKGRVGII